MFYGSYDAITYAYYLERTLKNEIEDMIIPATGMGGNFAGLSADWYA